jgi:FKBP-type peptidyl-prolyl cis-trans isomerase (trigger factor)
MTEKAKKETKIKKNTKDVKEKSLKTKITPSTKIEIILPQKEVKESFDKHLKNAAKTLKADGFREGKVPPHVARQMVNTQAILNKVIQDVLPKYYEEKIKKDKLTPITYPEVNLKSDDVEKDLIVEIGIAQKAKIDLKNYQELIKKSKKTAQKELEKRKTEKQEKPKINDDDFILNFILDNLKKELNPEIPELVLKNTMEDSFSKFNDQLKMVKLNIEDYLKKNNLTVEGFTNYLRNDAINKIQTDLIINQIIDDEKLKADPKEIEEFIEKSKTDKREMTNDDIVYLNYISQRRKAFDFVLKLK